MDWGKPKLRKGGKIRGKQKTEDANIIKKWLYPLLAKCDAAIPQKRKQRGWSTLKRKASQELRKNERKHPKHDDRRIKSVFEGCRGNNGRHCVSLCQSKT